MSTENPFYQSPRNTPFGAIPFAQIHVSHYEPALIEGMRQEDEAINRIVANLEAPTFGNTIAPCTDALLERVSSTLMNLSIACTSDEVDSIVEKMMPQLAAHSDRILLNAALFERVKQVYETREKLDAEARRLTEETYLSFVRNGANLSEADKATFAEINTKLASLTVQFGQNLLKDKNAFVLHIDNSADLAGLPQRVIDQAAETAAEKGMSGWVFTLQEPSRVPFLTYCQNRSLRQKMYMAYNTLCNQGNANDNNEIVRQIINLRLQKAQLMGCHTYAEYALQHTMAENIDTVESLLHSLLDACLPTAIAERDELERLAQETEGKDFKLQPWDEAYYSQKLKVSKFDVDEEQLRPYFPLAQVEQGVFNLAHRLYGITLKENKDIEVFHPDVKVLEVHDADGTFLALLYMDYYARDNKQGGAWMTNYGEQYINELGEDIRPLVSLTTNFPHPTAGSPSLLSPSEMETLLHEFGHCLHSIFSAVHYRALSGTNVVRDFVELPSQFMENYAAEPAFLHSFARHYQTGEIIPDEIIARIIASRQYRAASNCVRQLRFGFIDMGFHTQTKPIDKAIEEIEQTFTQQTQLLPHPKDTCMATQFSHIISNGYAAGYYGYKWAEVMDADVFAMFKEKDIFDRTTATRFRQEILSRGNTRPAMQLYTQFRGHKPDITHLLVRMGIKQSQ